ncbi:MAG: T9SS type A sorting domain-containing protein [Ignavibacteria bacterium]|nr:T9SS type A sorting domain-containing protein [Bacteroidota bacterium]MSQ46255.1 T9SS type A sorting domain-containing protein [Ignavibacteria bacterium]
MKKSFSISLLSLFVIVSSFAQYKTIDNFENPKPDSLYSISTNGGTVIKFSSDSVSKIEGNRSIKVKAICDNLASWGGWAQFGWSTIDFAKATSWQGSDSLSIWLKVTMAPTRPSAMSFRLQITDIDGAGNKETWVYQQNTILDFKTNNWVNLRIPLKALTSDGTRAPDSTGFSIAPYNWGHSQNDLKFDPSKVSSWYLTVLPTSPDADSIEVSFDKFEQFGTMAVPIIFFNGIDFTGIVSGTPWTWGQSVVTVEKNAGPIQNSNAIKWIQGNEWSNGWTGWGANLITTNMSGGWKTDSLQLKVKSQSGVGKLRIQFEDGTSGGKRGVNFTPTGDDVWRTYKFALKDFIYPPGEDSTKKGPIDSTKINVFGIMAEASSIAGKVLFFTDIWTGNPEFDVIAPNAPTGVVAIGGASGSYMNILTWNDVPNEENAKYNVFLSSKTFTKVDTSYVEDLPPYKIPSLTQAANHMLRAPMNDANQTFYYGVVCTDQSGNKSSVTVSNPVTTKAKGVPVISSVAPSNFAVDGSLSDWTNAKFKPIAITKTTATGEGHVVDGGTIDNDADLSVKAYFATDATNLYFGFDVVDDNVVDTLAAYEPWKSYGTDCVDFFLGLYNWTGKRHNGYTRGSNPDYHFRATSYALYVDNPGQQGGIKSLLTPGASYIFKKKSLTPGYIIEGKIPFKSIADSSGDTKYTPTFGDRIPIDFSINDNDGKTYNPNNPWEARDGILCYSILNNDNAWQDMWRWTYTWISTATNVKQDDIVANKFELQQNYPNPFNPTTNISFSIPKSGNVKMKIFDLIGREVMTIFDEHKNAGSYTLKFNASQLASGMYVYKIESGDFTDSKKMMLLK